MKQVNFLAILLVLCLLVATTYAVDCTAGSTKDSWCSDCVDSTATSDCNFCIDGYYKISAKACKKCPTGTGRSKPDGPVLIETEAVCLKCAPQLKCESCSENPHECTSCAAGNYLEPTVVGEVFVTGCSTNCSAFGTNNFLPSVPEIPFCKSCNWNCLKCELATNMKEDASSLAVSAKIPKCVQARDGYYLVPNTKDPTIVPSIKTCGANCKKCTDRSNCSECMSGWTKGANEKGDCTTATKVVSTPTGSPTSSGSSLAQVCFLLISLAQMSW
jgi:hypothetical protein